MNWVVGLTGGIGSGKSAAAEHFGSLGAAVVDTDRIAHQLTGPGGAALPALQAVFGPDILDARGAMDRAAMRTRVFHDAAARAHLEMVLHPLIREESLRQCRDATTPYVVLVVPLLVESAAYYRAHCQRLCVVDCPEALQVARVVSRNGLSDDDVRRIMDTQASRQARLAVADDVIDNSGTLETLYARVEVLHRLYLGLAAAAD